MRHRQGFTLMELLVVMGIIVLMTAMSLPAISKFLDGQSLQQSGRIVQSAFNDARRAAITQRTKQYLIFFRDTDQATREVRYGMRRYRERFGYEGDAHLLLPSTQFDLMPSSGSISPTMPTPTAPTQCIGRIRGLRLPVFEPLPNETDGQLFQERRPKTTDGSIVWLEFNKDGTVDLETTSGPFEVAPPADLFDVNKPFEVAQNVFDGLPGQVDMNLREVGDSADNVDKRCFCDLDRNTGRLSIRVVQVTNP